MRRALGALGVAAAMSIWWVMAFPGQAFAEVTGPCTAQVGGVDVTDGFDTPGNAIDVPADQQLQVAGTAEGRVTGLVYTVHIAGGGVNVGNVALGENGRNWSGTVDLNEFSWAGVGIFEVTAEVQTDAGECFGRVYLCIEGRNPLTTAAGGGAAAVGTGGVLLLGMSLLRSKRLGSARAIAQGFAGGATTALGAGVVLQQFCAVPLTLATAAVVPAGVGVMGSVASYGLRRAGRAGARRAAQRLGRAAGQAAGPPGGEPTEVLDRGARQLQRAGEQAAERGREVAESIRGAQGGGPAPAGPGGGGPAGGPAPAAPGGGGPAGGPAPAAPGGGGPAGGPAPAAPGGGGPAGGPAPAAPGGGGPAGGPAPAAPGGGGPAGGPAPAAPGGGGPAGGPAPAAPGGGGPAGGPAPAAPGGGGPAGGPAPAAPGGGGPAGGPAPAAPGGGGPAGGPAPAAPGGGPAGPCTGSTGGCAASSTGSGRGDPAGHPARER